MDRDLTHNDKQIITTLRKFQKGIAHLTVVSSKVDNIKIVDGEKNTSPSLEELTQDEIDILTQVWSLGWGSLDIDLKKKKIVRTEQSFKLA